MNNNKWLELTNGVCWSIIFSIAAIIMSIAALADTHPRTLYSDDNKTIILGFDYIGVIVAILALLVTFLVAWQIYNSIDSKDRIKEVERKVHKLLYANLSHVFYVQGEAEHKRQNYDSALSYYFRGVDCAYKGSLDNEVNQIIKSIYKLLKNTPTIRISIADSDSYCEIVSSLNHMHKQDIINILNSVKDENAPTQEHIWDVTMDANNI